MLVVRIVFFVFGQIKAQCSAWIHDVIRIKVLLERAEDVVFIFAERPLQPGSEHLADAVMMAHRCAGFLNRRKNPGVVRLKCLGIALFDDEDKVEVGALRIDMGHVRHADRIRAGFAECADIRMYLRHVAPVDRALHRVHDDAEIL
ncbi:hypothetical protein SDC9_162250 [bioreactor metagenome]|uniref:Uncharacterized protein n=1 Tax=bioreactor metagenome TaxID=1076179 RepID=A0A645FKL1_9ZZZZ